MKVKGLELDTGYGTKIMFNEIEMEDIAILAGASKEFEKFLEKVKQLQFKLNGKDVVLNLNVSFREAIGSGGSKGCGYALTA